MAKSVFLQYPCSGADCSIDLIFQNQQLLPYVFALDRVRTYFQAAATVAEGKFVAKIAWANAY